MPEKYPRMIRSSNTYADQVGITLKTAHIYQKNLNTILSSLSENVDEYGFYNASIGQDPDRVSAVVLCRGDVELNLCRGCVKDADCKVAYGWYVKCLIYFSNETIIGSMSSDTLSLPCNNQNAIQPAKFNPDLRSMLDRLLSQATQGGPFLKFAAGNTSAPDLNTMGVWLPADQPFFGWFDQF